MHLFVRINDHRIRLVIQYILDDHPHSRLTFMVYNNFTDRRRFPAQRVLRLFRMEIIQELKKQYSDDKQDK